MLENKSRDPAALILYVFNVTKLIFETSVKCSVVDIIYTPLCFSDC